MNLLLQVAIEKIETRADSTLKIILGTQELTLDQETRLFQLRRKMAYCALSEQELPKEGLKALEPLKTSKEPIKEGKSPSQKLRSVMWIVWNNQGAKGEFNDYYNNELNKITNHYKEKLP